MAEDNIGVLNEDKYFGTIPYETLQKQFVEQEHEFSQFAPLLEIDDWNSDEEGRAPKNEFEAQELREFDDIRQKYFDMKIDWYDMQIKNVVKTKSDQIKTACDMFRKRISVHKSYFEKLEYMF